MPHDGRMKCTLFVSALLVGMPLLQAATPPSLEVHEWGTFTVLSGGGLTQVSWYTPERDLAHLPPFVHPGIIGKFAMPNRIRMETPVIYFYPEKPMAVSVEASFEEGTISETYPYGSLQFIPGSGMGMRFKARWSGQLRPPTDKRALALIPGITPGEHEEPYGAAREVPDAWIFESDLKQLPGAKEPLTQPEADKFIFYRGAGNADLPVQADISRDQVSLRHHPIRELRHSVVLRVRGGRAGWATIAIPASEDPTENLYQVSAPLPEIDRSLDEVEAELAADWKQALAANGLTPAEASAMVETWRKTWFREEGDRVLTLMPRAAIDAMLPLTVTPTPSKLERVFVARLELIAPQRAEMLAGLLESVAPAEVPDGLGFKIHIPEAVLLTSVPPVAQAITDAAGTSPDLRALDGLKFGRFEAGAIDIAIAQRAQSLREAYSRLSYRRAQAEQRRIRESLAAPVDQPATAGGGG